MRELYNMMVGLFIYLTPVWAIWFACYLEMKGLI